MKCISIFKCKPQIEVIDKSHCNLEDVPNFQSYSRSLEELFLDANKLTLLNENVFRLTKLRRFSFSDNAVQDIPPDIARLVNLVELDCSRNRIQIIPEQIKFLRGLQVCDFSGNDIEYLPIGLVQLRNLTILTLNYCLIKNLPEDIGLLKNLESLELRENEIEILPTSITGLESLKKLDVGRNLISKLPDDIGRLKKLEYLLLDSNRLQTIPPKIGQLENLQCLDLSKQELFGFKHLPEEISGLISLTDLHLSENHLTSLPNGIKELRNLTILKADGNILSDLNPNIGGCVSLQELVLTSNEINKFPASIGNLIDLRSLNVDDNMLTELPEQIGNLKCLGILSLRDNILTNLPAQIGQLESAKVMDFSGNRLEYLPVSITALNLNALWLSKNQAQPLPKLQIDELPDGTRILTCYLLPQQNEAGNEPTGSKPDLGEEEEQTTNNYRPVAVSFATAIVDDVDIHDDVNFVRHDTPHPRELRARHQKLFGNLGNNNTEEQVANGQSNELRGHSNEAFNPADNQTREKNLVNDFEYESNGLPEINPQMKRGRLAAEYEPPMDNVYAGEYNHSPNYRSKDHDIKLNQGKGSQFDNNNDGCYVMDIVVRRTSNHKSGLGLSIAGGKDTPPFKNDDDGIFVSKVTPGGPAEAANVRVGDKILAVNNHQFYDGITHHEAVDVFKKLRSDCSEFTIRVLRDPNDEISLQYEDQGIEGLDSNSTGYNQRKSPSPVPKPSRPSKNTKSSTFSRTYTIPIQSEATTNGSEASDAMLSHNNQRYSLANTKTSNKSSELSSRPSLLDTTGANKNIIYATLVNDYKHDLGIEFENQYETDNGKSNGWSNIVISAIKPNSIAAKDGRLQVDDRLLSINGTDVNGIDLDRIKLMLNGTERFIRMVVSRGDMNDPIGAALRNIALKPSLGSLFSSTSNMVNKPSLIDSYQRPKFGSVTNLQGNKPPKPPKPSHLLAKNDESLDESEDLKLESKSSQPSTYDESGQRVKTANLSNKDVESSSDFSNNEPISEFEKRSQIRRERLKSIEDDVEMAKIIVEAHRWRNEDRK